ncbi:peptidoglycan-binding protein LysM [Paracoccus siganidrum]|uniref:Potassium binding protein Kbp n=1 Tax=Paracoccus siganidrum TaxID=1276757 RepID=A0A419A6J2_9RHOB|nr:peptidoglycan-binding protein LysM [Paracoccus siganidrum]RJL14208.1 peptidoglycan-binding protein LysM [Paracoccus siganidrum]RMC33460.1 peptidoglycan-binding protein LysM [Paracoccus siganidrum]
MAIWDFVKDAGKSVFGKAEAAQPAAPAATPADAPKPAAQDDTQRKVDALKAELRALGLGGKDVHLTLRGDTVKIESRGADRETMEKLVLAVGNIEGIAKVEAELPEEPVFHTVQKGETLSAIAKKHLGDANKYNAIFEANRPMLTHPDKIYPGQVLRIPAG